MWAGTLGEMKLLVILNYKIMDETINLINESLSKAFTTPEEVQDAVEDLEKVISNIQNYENN